MSVCPEDILATARKLASGTPSESDIRSCASRAYYAALHATNQAIPDSYAEKTADVENSHISIINKAQRLSKELGPGRTEAAQLFALLPKAKKIRVKADYRLGEKFDPIESQRLIDQAEKALELCNILTQKLPK